MQASSRPLFNSSFLLVPLLITTVLLYVLRQWAFAPDVLTTLKLLGNDDHMRLLQVRDLLAGQGWFDTRQYRVLPPEGISIHWSRLIDAPMAALLSVLTIFTDMPTAERLLTVLWPLALFAAFALMTMRIARHGFGVPAAVLALIALWFLNSHHQRYFSFGRLDHHNVQLILMMAVFGFLCLPSRRGAVLAGIFASLSLAIGLEAVVFLAVAALVWVWRYILGAPDARAELSGFCLGLGLSTPVFFVFQSPFAGWGETHCDQLSAPFLLITTGAAVLGVLLMLFQRYQESATARALVILVPVIGLLTFIWPLLSPCLAGPFADVPVEVRSLISNSIGESIPAFEIMRRSPEQAIGLLLPQFLVTALVVLIWTLQDHTSDARRIWGLLALFLMLGCLGAFLQLRAVIWGHVVLAVGFGAISAYLINHIWPVSAWLKGLAMVLLFTAVFMPQLAALGYNVVAKPWRTTVASPIVQAAPPLDRACNRPGQMAQLNAVASGVFLTPLNLGTSVLVHSHHAVTSAPYHRSARAMLLGVEPFRKDDGVLKAAISETGATAVLVCAGQVYGGSGSIGTKLANGESVEWLKRAEGLDEPLILYHVRGSSLID